MRKAKCHFWLSNFRVLDTLITQVWHSLSLWSLPLNLPLRVVKIEDIFVKSPCPGSKNPNPTRTHFLPPATSGGGTTIFSSPPPRLAPYSDLVTRFEPQSMQQGAENRPDRWQKNSTRFFYSGHSVTGKTMSFVPLNPRNLSMVVDHNENKPNFTN